MSMYNARDRVRLESTRDIIAGALSGDSVVVEIGSNDASFRDAFPHVANWTTFDKFGDPDVVVDLDADHVSLGIDSDSVDLVICTEVLEHLRIGSPLVEEFARVLRPNGRAVISVPNIASAKSRIRLMVGQVPNMAASGDCGTDLGGSGLFLDGRWRAGHVVDFNLERLRGFLERGGLVVQSAAQLPVELPVPRTSRRLTIPGKFLPPTFGDYLLVECAPAG